MSKSVNTNVNETLSKMLSYLYNELNEERELNNRKEEAKKKLFQRLKENKLEDDDDILFYIADASRYCSIDNSGEWDINKFLLILGEKFDKFKDRLDEIILERCDRGIYEVRHSDERSLGHAIIEAQDFSSFKQQQKGLLKEETIEKLEDWEFEADSVFIDDEIKEMLLAFKNTFPINEDEMLYIILSPQTKEEIEEEIANMEFEEIDLKWEDFGGGIYGVEYDGFTFLRYVKFDHLVVETNYPGFVFHMNIRFFPIAKEGENNFKLDLKLVKENYLNQFLKEPLRVHLKDGRTLVIRF